MSRPKKEQPLSAVALRIYVYIYSKSVIKRLLSDVRPLITTGRLFIVAYLLSSIVPLAVTDMVLLPDSKFWLGTEASAEVTRISIAPYIERG